MEISGYIVGASAVVVASAVGSFIGCAVDRVACAQSFVWVRSQCRSCGRILSPSELVPIVSFAAQLGRCRSCRDKIPRGLLYIELLALLPVLLLLWLSFAEAAAGLLLCWLLLALAVFDLADGRLPDALTGTLGASGLMIAALVGDRLGDAVMGAAIGFGLLYLVAIGFRWVTTRDGLGGGDIKLLGALGAWVGWQGVPWVLLAASVSGIVFAVVSGRRARTSIIPFGPFLAIAGVVVWYWQHAG